MSFPLFWLGAATAVLPPDGPPFGAVVGTTAGGTVPVDVVLVDPGTVPLLVPPIAVVIGTEGAAWVVEVVVRGSVVVVLGTVVVGGGGGGVGTQCSIGPICLSCGAEGAYRPGSAVCVTVAPDPVQSERTSWFAAARAWLTSC